MEDGLTQDGDGCTVFMTSQEPGVRYLRNFEVETQGRLYFDIKYRLKGALQCEDRKFMFVSQSCTNAQNCEISRRESCHWMVVLTNENQCHMRCWCVGGVCKGRVVVTGIEGMPEWSLCEIEIG